jgi:hypothetical protein
MPFCVRGTDMPIVCQSETSESVLATIDDGLVMTVEIGAVDRPTHVDKVDVLIYFIQRDTNSL